jgi:hypothetical protein
LYEYEWYNEDKSFRNSAKIVMEASKKSMAISVYGIFKVDLQTFLRIYIGTYSLFTVFQQMNAE